MGQMEAVSAARTNDLLKPMGERGERREEALIDGWASERERERAGESQRKREKKKKSKRERESSSVAFLF